MDFSFFIVIVEEHSEVKYYSFKGEEADVFKTFRYVGINDVRVRIWNDPYDSEGHGYDGEIMIWKL